MPPHAHRPGLLLRSIPASTRGRRPAARCAAAAARHLLTGKGQTTKSAPAPAPAAAAARTGTGTGTGRSSSSFKGQMMESIAARIAREREERNRAAKERGESAASKNWAFTGILLFTGAACWFLGRQSPRHVDPESTLALRNTRFPRHKTAEPDLQAAWADFVSIVGKDHVSTAATDKEQHASSAWSSYRNQDPAAQPFCVVYPATTEHVSRIMKVCHTRRIPVTGYSGGTSIEGHVVPTRGGITIDFSRMDKILALHREDLDVVVQPGVRWEQLNEHMAQHNLFFPPDPGPGAMIGGMIGTGCSGTNAYRYGTIREWVIGLTVVLADGNVIRTRQRPRKSSAGYDLTKLFIGSEGTLGLVTEATLKLAIKPAATLVAVATFPSVRSAADCVGRVVGDGVPIAAVELLDDKQMRAVNAAGMTTRAWAEAPTLFFKFAGTDRGVQEQVAMVKGLAKRSGGLSFAFATSPDEQTELWSARKEALWSTMALGKPGDHVWTGDVAVPVSRLPDIMEETQDDVQKSGLMGTLVGHVGDGNFHLILLYNDHERELAEDCVRRMVKRAVDMEGTVSGEHGVGLVKRDYLAYELGESTVDAMRKIKQAFDPLCLLNCDKVVRMQTPKPCEVASW